MKAAPMPGWARSLMAPAAVAALYATTGKLGFLAALSPGNVTTAWPPSGIALAALLLLGNRVWPGIWLGSFLVNIWVFPGTANGLSLVSLAISACIAAGASLQALLGAFLIRRFLGTHSPFSHPQDTFRFVGIALLSCLVAPTFAVTSVCVAGFIPWSAFLFTWWAWCLGNTTGIIVVTPLILAWSNFTVHKWRAPRLAEFALALTLLVAACLGIFGGPPTLVYSHAYAILPLLIWAAFRFGPKGVSLFAAVTSGIAIWATYHGHGPFVEATRGESLISLHTFLDVLAVTGLVLAAAVMDRGQVAGRFRLLFESAPNAMLMVGSQGRIILANSQAAQLFGFQPGELIGQPIEALVPQRFHGEHSAYRTTFFGRPEARPMGGGRDLFATRKDGSEFPVEIALNPIATAEGTLVLSAIVDISERKRAENELRTALEEKEILMQEIHHRIKNNLQIISSLLSIQSRRIEDKRALHTFKDSQNRIDSIALVHEILCHSKDLSELDVAKYLRELSSHLLLSYGNGARTARLELEVEEVRLSVDKAVPLGLLITEVVSNSLIHAFPSGKKGTVRVELHKASVDQLALTLSDDGIGFPEEVDFQHTHSIGLQLVNKLAEQLHGTVEFQPKGGTTFKMLFHR